MATMNACYRQKKRAKNHSVRKLLCSGVSQRRAAILLNLNRKTVVRMFLIEAERAELRLRLKNHASDKAETVEFDDLETFEHTKCKPLSVTLAVEHSTRRILGLEVSSMRCKGPLAEKSRELYGPRIDDRTKGRNKLFQGIHPFVHERPIFKSDLNPHYPKSVEKYFPTAKHLTFKGKRGCSTGQGELKKLRFDPLFSLNHTCAMLRANVNRLFRKTWCTTKKMDRLQAHLILYADYHNQVLLKLKPDRRAKTSSVLPLGATA